MTGLRSGEVGPLGDVPFSRCIFLSLLSRQVARLQVALNDLPHCRQLCFSFGLGGSQTNFSSCSDLVIRLAPVIEALGS